MTWPVHPDTLVLVALLEGGYAALAVRGARRSPDVNIVSRRKVWLYSLGVFTLWVAAGTPIHDWGEQYLFSVHMIEHLLMSMVAAPLMLLGTHDWQIRPFVTKRAVFPVLRFLTFPIIAIIAYNAYTVYMHLPGTMDFVLTHHAWHFVAHVALMATSFMLWWPVFSPLPELPRLHFSFQMIYLFVQSLVPSIVASIITYGTTVLYPFYLHAPRRWGLSPLQDQVMAGLLMKLAGGTLIFILICAVFMRWYHQEQRDYPDALEALDRQGPPPPPADLRWPEVEEELGRMGLTRPSAGSHRPSTRPRP